MSQVTVMAVMRVALKITESYAVQHVYQKR